jgi:hypothetical protein
MTQTEILDKLKIGNYIKFSGTLYCESSVGESFLIPNNQFFRIEDQQSRFIDNKLEVQIKLYIGKTLLAPIFPVE